MLSRRAFLRWAFGGLATVAAFAGYPLVEVMATPRVTRYRLTPRNWTPRLKLHVVALADFHACDPWMTSERIRSICDQANALEPDIILLLGDYVRGMNRFVADVPASDWSAAMAGLSAPLGVHAVLGNHDCWEDLSFQRDPKSRTIAEKALSAIGVEVYVNRAVRIEKDAVGFWLAGLGDQMALRPGKRFGRTQFAGTDDLPLTLDAIHTDEPVLLMAHEPDIFDRADGRVSLTLSGHTHGGQINLFGWRPVSASVGSARYPAGHFHKGGRDLVVSRGLGCTMLPIRVGAWPEILSIQLG
ncbi:metallophosphoesterase [Rhizobium sp. FKL33]|uniref:metallophosphoesterase n=1 Tax=Rhizobium sp. FKL33 TaxID=2562307 RepID=UPI0010BFE2F2|nr:metallophosphoesterase [Rhizobium sp. FKL33]